MKQILMRIVNIKRSFWQGLGLFLALFVLSIALGVKPALATTVYDLPEISVGDAIWAIDQGDVLSRLTKGKLNQILGDLAQKTGSEVRLVTVERLEYGSTIDSFAKELFTNWFPTPEESAHQVVLVVDRLTNQIAIQTGAAIKEILPEAVANSIAQDNLGLPVHDGFKYNEGFLSASNRLIAILSGKPDPGAPVARETLNIAATYTSAEETKQGSSTIWVVGLLIVATVVPMVTYFAYVGFK